ncbi:ubiquitin carboxyl-terminal hydrolase 18 [Arachis duranensis]|uniref:ubiquitinyl hydrolase 1 n=1 Tax=Arachis duranensis TaxID=130453 RepID=A0A6P4E1D7_ARADU|nr:ubiquitin carboxyl-terminal hydrolase 18 [Arachis duranensis]XP_057718042.1 ubiquitin carboxyl-terminal hydrolase 18-like [Arachis stenosperma]
MLVAEGTEWDLKWFLQWLSALVIALALHTFVKDTASKYFQRNSNNRFDNHLQQPMPGVLDDPSCAACGARATKKCSRCKAVRYCSQECQQSHWKSGHKAKCTVNSKQNGTTNCVSKPSAAGEKSSSSIALIPSSKTSRPIKKPKDVLFPYDEFIKFFNSEKPGFPPCGLLNCGNSCFGNVVLQCLSFTRPLVAYLLEKGHHRECSCNSDWCFLCEFEAHVERTRSSSQAFSPTSILSRLSNISGTLGCGSQEDAHEFMRLCIDAMQSVCLDEFGGEKAVPPKLQETTLIQHIFGGRLQSEVFCTKCENISKQYENMMDLTVEIHGDAASLEECLDQFTAKEWLHGENMYKCDGCKDYVKAWKRLTVNRAPNILTIALKRFQSGRFGKLNKRISFPETLNLSPYMSEAGDGSDIYKLYAVVVHIDMLNASFFGHYICYIKDFNGNWYRIDDWKVTKVDMEEVLSQGAYMLLYNRSSAQPSSLQIQATESSEPAPAQTVKVEREQGPNELVECLSNMNAQAATCNGAREVSPSYSSPEPKVSGNKYEPLSGMNADAKGEHSEDVDISDAEPTDVTNISSSKVESSDIPISPADKDSRNADMDQSQAKTSSCTEKKDDTHTVRSGPSAVSPTNFAVSMGRQNMGENLEHNTEVVKCKLSTTKDNAYCANGNGNGYASANKSITAVEDAETDQGNEANKVGIKGDKLIM